MTTYARLADGVVYELLTTDGDITEMFPPGMEWIALGEADSDVAQGWIYDAATEAFTAPVPPVPTPENIVSTNTATKTFLLALATVAIAPLQDAVDLDDATEADLALLKKWKQYRVAVNRIDLTLKDPAWPDQPK